MAMGSASVMKFCSCAAELGVCLLPSDRVVADLIKPESLGFLEYASHRILVAVAVESCMVLFCKSKEGRQL